MKNLKCKLGLHKWINHYGASHHTRKFEGWSFWGIALGVVSAMVIAIFAPFNTSIDPSQLAAMAIGAFIIPSMIGVIGGSIGNVIQDRSCLNCLKHDFSFTIWKSKKDMKRARKEKLRQTAVNDYQETKQFLKV